MKQGRRLTRAEKFLLNQEGLNPKDYLRERKTSDTLIFINRDTGKLVSVRY